MEIGMISVDKWKQGSQAYFLTHLHSDHTSGLTPTWKWAPLFCSRHTAHLFPSKFPGFKLSLLRILEIGSWSSLSLRSPSTGSFTTFHVIAIDANHCPGAVMYLFHGEFGNLLYTGDFRWERTSKRAEIGRTMLLNALNNEKLDILYLDNTYCNPSYIFPSREIAAKQVVNIIESHPNHEIIIGINSLGKEELLVYISRMLKIKIWVWPERLRTMHLLGIKDIFTTKTSLTRVRAVPCYSFSHETLQALNNTSGPTIGIMPSGLPWINNKTKTEALTKSNTQKCGDYMYTVPYSDHSCYSEIKDFIEVFKPSNVKGIVSSTNSYIDPIYYFGLNKLDLKREREEEKSIEKRKIRRVRVKRVSILRKMGCGVKIVDT